jgi:glucose/arabinose dehydrogenase
MRLLPIVVALALLAACTATDGAGSGGDAAESEEVTAADAGVTVEQVVSGLRGPTQMIDGPDGRLWVAQLAGGENAGDGQVVAIEGDGGEPEVLLDGLAKPTGIAWLDGALWIATPTEVLRAEGDPPGEPEPVVAGLPNNGRSQGTLTATPDGDLLYEVTGRERDGGAVDGSGALYVMDPGAPDAPRLLASGFKNAYAHVYDDDGRLWTTEVAEPIGGSPAPDEIVRVVEGADHGWPACVGDRQPVAAFGGDEQRCADTVRPVATFEPVGATPTSIVLDPTDPDRFVVTLWNAGRVVAVPVDGGAEPNDLITGLEHPQHLLVDGDAVLVSDFATGTIWRITPEG